MNNNRLLPSPVGFLRSRFSFLLISLLSLFLLQTFLVGHPLSRYFLPGFLLVIVFASLSAFSDNRKISLMTGVFGFVILALRYGTYVSESSFLLLMSDSSGALFFAFIAVLILAAVLRAQTVTGDTISGALCVYLLLGIVWAFLFMLVESVHPGSFQIAEAERTAVDPKHGPSASLSLFMYFSLVTLSTVGYGDVIPLTGPARGLAAFEGVMGQFYLAVLVARLVGLYASRSQR